MRFRPALVVCAVTASAGIVSTVPSPAPAAATGSWCTSSAESSKTDRVALSPTIPSLLTGADFATMTDAAAGDLALRILRASGPLPTAVAEFGSGADIKRWMADLFDNKDNTAFLYMNELETAYHETLHSIQVAASCFPTGTNTGLATGDLITLGPAQSTTRKDVVDRAASQVGTTSRCASTVPALADTYLTGKSGDLGIWSQIAEVNAYVIGYELSVEWDTAMRGLFGTMRLPNTMTATLKMHQLARYLESTRTVAESWNRLRSRGVDASMRWHYNLLADIAVPVGNGTVNDFRDCWTLAFGQDATAIGDFVAPVGSLSPPRVAIASATSTATGTTTPSVGSTMLQLRRGAALSKASIAALVGTKTSAVRSISVDRRDRSRCSATSTRVKGLKRGTCRLVVSVQSGKSRTTKRLTLTVV